MAMLLLLNSQAHERRAPNPAARVPPVIWQQVRLLLQHIYMCIYIWNLLVYSIYIVNVEKMCLSRRDVLMWKS